MCTHLQQGIAWSRSCIGDLQHCTCVFAHNWLCAGNAQAWRLLGTAHAENDDDRQAIAAMAKALAADPDSPEVLLALGVSHVNELQESQAVSYLMRCAVRDDMLKR